MAAPSGKLDPVIENPLIDLLRREPFRVRFFEAVRLLRLLYPLRKPVGTFEKPENEVVRFAANPSLDFPASEIQEMRWPDPPEKPSEAEQPPTMIVNFMGLCSPMGVLPTPYLEEIIDRGHRRDNAFRDFLDIFNHRMISLFYRAWEKYNFYVGYERGETDKLTPMLRSLIGLETTGLLRRQTVPDDALVYYAGILSQHPRTAQGLCQILEDYFQVEIEVEQFVGKWVRVPEEQQTYFDDGEPLNLKLGYGTVVGDEIWDQQTTLRIKIGPLTRTQYLDFLPRPEAKAYPALKSLLKFYSNDQMDFEVQLVLKQEEAPSLELHDQETGGLMLGWITWIKNAPLGRDPGETILQM